MTYTEAQKQQQGLECEICSYANEHGWWGPDHKGTHCRVCHKSWTGLNEIHCVKCHKQFSNEQACNLHQTGIDNIICHNPEDLKDKNGKPKLMLSTRERLYPGPVWTVYRDTDETDRLSILR